MYGVLDLYLIAALFTPPSLAVKVPNSARPCRGAPQSAADTPPPTKAGGVEASIAGRFLDVLDGSCPSPKSRTRSPEPES